MSDTDWFDVLKSSLQGAQPSDTMRPEDVEMLIGDIVAGRIQAPARRRNHRAPRKLVAAGVIVGVLGSGAAVAALWNTFKPDRPHEGIACHASADVAVTRAVVIAPAADPIAACAKLWRSGALPDVDGGAATDVIPNLFMCVGRGGGLEVFPRLSDVAVTCDDLGLSETEGVSIHDPLIVLQDRLSNDINSTCTDLQSARKLARAALSDLSLNNWTIVVQADTAGCVAAGEDPATQSIFLFSNHTQPPTT